MKTFTNPAAFAVCCLAAVCAAAQSDEPSPSKSSLDQQLLEGLDRELGGSAPRKPAADANGKPSSKAGAGEHEPDNPLAKIAARMRAIERQLAEGKLTQETQQEQQEVLKQLAELLQQAGKQGGSGQGEQSGGGSGQGQQAAGGTGQPAPGAPQDSTDRIERGTPDQAQAVDVQDVVSRIWGHLPDKMREEMRSSMSERFLPKYERLIEAYYRKLAEQPAGGP